MAGVQEVERPCSRSPPFPVRHRRRSRRDPRVVVVAKPGGGPPAGRARLRPLRARLRVRRAETPGV